MWRAALPFSFIGCFHFLKFNERCYLTDCEVMTAHRALWTESHETVLVGASGSAMIEHSRQFLNDART